MPRSLASLGLLILLSGCTHDVRQVQLMTDDTRSIAANLEWCGTLQLPTEWQDGSSVGGLSALAWDADEALLYMISDRGWLHHAQPRFSSGKLIDLHPLSTYRLSDQYGNPLDKKAADAESLLLQSADNGVAGDTKLLIGFERSHRIQQFSSNGKPTGPPRSPRGFRGAQYNAGAEAMARHSSEGIIVGLESSPQGGTGGFTRLFSLDSDDEWIYPLADASGSALTALEPYGDDLLALERAYAPPASLVISLRRVSLSTDPHVEVTTLAQLSSAAGWRLDNFEGLTHLDGSRYLMISDDNFSLFQETLLSCFEIKYETAAHQAF